MNRYVFLVDTNVISEVMKVAPSERVIDWLDQKPTTSLHIPTIAIGEIEYGLQSLPAGKRRTSLKAKFERFVSLAFAQRVLSYDEVAAHAYGELMSHRRELGRPMSIADGQIAAIALTRGLTVATRNTRDFEDCGVELTNPFL